MWRRRLLFEDSIQWDGKVDWMYQEEDVTPEDENSLEGMGWTFL